ncbi:FadR/GntR family transcriptional regulator [Pseudonocardia sp. KRD291]|uniref:FadR/GntR family transcriptional regulator n=1 Tax=Pseudonocardia sp. KRD291 TaxID=2792007 RepID=UPI001C4A363C|nr:FCD domain-containing protein [Pseudonocardia sp. KRD291]MBW0106019.1 FadR family transcriptional regulator [Pseudonocardia sp. KRD291]
MTTWRKLERGPVVPQVEALLRERLLSGGWSPGEKVPSESTLATEIGVGRSSVREAVRLLGRDGLLEVRHGSGTFVASAEAPSAPVAELLRRARLLEVYEVRRSLEVEASRLAAHRAGTDDLAGLRTQLAERAARAHAPESFVVTDLDFHESIVRLSGNSVLVELFAYARPVIQAALIDRIAHDGPLIDVDRAHDDLVTALENHDVEAAVEATVANLQRTIDDLRAEEVDR